MGASEAAAASVGKTAMTGGGAGTGVGGGVGAGKGKGCVMPPVKGATGRLDQVGCAGLLGVEGGGGLGDGDGDAERRPSTHSHIVWTLRSCQGEGCAGSAGTV